MGLAVAVAGLAVFDSGSMAGGVALAAAGLLLTVLAVSPLGKLDRTHPTVPSGPPAPAATAELGALAGILPSARLTECSIQSSPPVGILTDGQGFAAVLELEHTALPTLDLAALTEHLASDPATPSGLQILVEHSQKRRRLLLAVRHEPLFAPDATTARGGGAHGASKAAAATALRLRAVLTQRGIRTSILPRNALRDAVLTLGDASHQGQLRTDAWITPAAAHCVLAAAPRSPQHWEHLLAAASTGPADRTIVALSVEMTGKLATIRAAVRIVARDHQRAMAARSTMLSTATVRPLSGRQAAGVHLSLPFGGTPRNLTHAIVKH
ncbi:type VII secretion protein EccE [Herbihabitans rhizosphaerae]|uniref:type VII secretion protein EccE n=1 Tax=Herbihabitans rhizosphaerae TaxID=1872711 RepID=UPI00102BBE8B|nr:type VII secretion protein EccE [Herbihabitans rhizosphaerae]